MSPWQVALLAAVWIAIGLATAVVLKRRGHEFGPNAALGAVLGPIFVFLALDTIRRREHDKPIQLTPSATTRGKRVLVVAVGEVEDPGSALDALTATVGEIGPVTLAVPVEHEVAERVHRMDGAPPHSENLDRVTEALSVYSPGRMMLPGRVDEAIPIGVGETDAEVVLLIGEASSTVAPGLEDQLDVTVIRASAPSHPDSSS